MPVNQGQRDAFLRTQELILSSLPATQPELTKITGLHRASVSRHVLFLLETEKIHVLKREATKEAKAPRIIYAVGPAPEGHDPGKLPKARGTLVGPKTDEEEVDLWQKNLSAKRQKFWETFKPKRDELTEAFFGKANV